MALPSDPDFLLFVAGEPDATGDSMRDVITSISARFVTVISPVGHWTQPSRRGEMSGFSHDPNGPEHPWHIPQPQVVCADLVVKTANDAGKSVRVVDVNRPEEFRDLVNRWVTSEDVLPILIRPDGARLEGVEQFVPKKVRRFIRGWASSPVPPRSVSPALK